MSKVNSRQCANCGCVFTEEEIEQAVEDAGIPEEELILFCANYSPGILASCSPDNPERDTLYWVAKN